MNWYIVSIITPLLLTIYLVIIDFVDLYPFNDVSKHTANDRKLEVLLNYPLPLIAALGNWYGATWSKSIAIFIGVLFLLGNIISWWVPYFFGCSEKQREHYEESFAQTIKILPPIKDHPIPNAEHMPVALFIIVWLISSIANL